MKTSGSLLVIFAFFTFLISVNSCTEDSFNVKPKPVSLDISSIEHQDPLTALGRVLFYDTKLSVNNAISCASCHKQALAFGDNTSFSQGFQNEPSLRNSPPIQNISAMIIFPEPFSQFFFWDGRETNLNNLVLQPVVNHVEMGMDDVDALLGRLRGAPYYSELFRNAYGNPEVSAAKVSEALMAFLSNLNTTSPRALNSSLLTAAELEGKRLFEDKYNCGSCHGHNGYGMSSLFMNIGLDLNYSDQGRQNVTGDPADAGKFRVPSLFNVAITAPYMHDGRFATLSEVLDHYSHGIENHPNLSEKLKDTNGNPMQMSIPETEKEMIIEFLNSFTSMAALGSNELSNPFHQ